MVIVKLWGGLCNQMFQYAFAYQIAKKNNDKVCFDVEFYNNQPKYVDSRKLELCSNYRLSTFDIIERPKFIDLFQSRYVSFFTRKLNFMHIVLPGKVFYIKEKEHKYSDNIPYIPTYLNYYDGYWQTEEYFQWVSQDIRREFEFSEEVKQKVQDWLTAFNGYELIGLHIRRGDLAGKSYGYSDKSMIAYYHRAVKEMEKKLDNPMFVVFSDDIEWCKKKMKWETMAPIIYADNSGGAIFDLCGISMCDHGIMSQSTFSWWGNWLGDSDKRIVIAPKKESFNDRFIPDRWGKI